MTITTKATHSKKSTFLDTFNGESFVTSHCGDMNESLLVNESCSCFQQLRFLSLGNESYYTQFP